MYKLLKIKRLKVDRKRLLLKKKMNFEVRKQKNSIRLNIVKALKNPKLKFFKKIELQLKKINKFGNFNNKNTGILIKKHFEKESTKKLKRIASKTDVSLNYRMSKSHIVNILTQKFLNDPLLLEALGIDIFRFEILDKIELAISPGNIVNISVTKDHYFCLEEIFSISGWGFKKSTSKDWLKTKHFKEYLNAASDLLGIKKTELLIVDSMGKTYAHQSLVIEGTRYRSPKLAVLFNEATRFFFNEFASSTEFRGAIKIAQPQSKASPDYELALAEIHRLKETIIGLNKIISNNNIIKPTHHFGKQLGTNYSLLCSSGIIKMGQCLNIDKTLAQYRRNDFNIKIITLIYHTENINDRFEFEKCIARRFSDYHVVNEQYGKMLKPEMIKTIWLEIEKGSGFNVRWETSIEIAKYNEKF